MKYERMIAKLTEQQKIALLTDPGSLSDIECKTLGLPRLRLGSYESDSRRIYPSPSSLACTWDRDLTRAVASDVCYHMARGDVNHVILPSAKPRISPYRTALSEDPYLSGELAGEYLRAAEEVGVSAGMDGFFISEDETDWLDAAPNERIIREFVVRPYRAATGKGACASLVTSIGHTVESYGHVNPAMADAVVDGGLFGEGTVSLCRGVSASDTEVSLARRRICLDGSSNALQTALIRYRKLAKEIRHGHVTTGELEAEIVEGRAMSPEMLDAAVNRLLCFADACESKKPAFDPEKQERDALLRRAAYGSVVLVKNEKHVLPLRPKTRVCIVGGILRDAVGSDKDASELFSERLAACGCELVGYTDGFDMSTDRSEEMIAEAVSLAEKSDVVLLFVGTNEEKERYITKTGKLTLPANQAAVADALARLGKTVVAVLSSSYALDVGFADTYAGLIVAPLYTQYGADAVIDTLLGTHNPSGKLPWALYANTVHGFGKQLAYRTQWNMKSGPFMGYRYADTAGFGMAYPFGHGLSYTKTAYSRFRIDGDRLTFSLKNTSKQAAVEIVQVYAGIRSSAVLRPQKELVAFERVELAAGESKTVEITISVPAVHDTSSGREVVESGTYDIYVGASLEDIRLTGKWTTGDATLTPDGERLSDYLQSESNIKQDKYTLEANYKLMKRSVRNLVFGIAALVIAASIKIFTILTKLDALFLDIVAIATVVLGVSFFVMEMIDRQKINAEERAAIDKANAEHFEGAEPVSVFAADRMFVEEFDAVDKHGDVVREELDDGWNAEYMAHVNKELTFEVACREFETFAAEKGYTVDAATVKEIFSAMASSRLVATRGMSDESFGTLVQLLSEYFECPYCMDTVTADYQSESDVLFSAANRQKRNVMRALESANTLRPNIHIAALNGVALDGMSAYFVPFARYARNPLSSTSVTATNERGVESVYYIPKNMWFLLNLIGSEPLSVMPDYVAEIVSVCHVELARCKPAEGHIELRKFKYYQLDYLTDRVKSHFEVDEDTWKRIDRLEDYTNKHESYRIGNKLWVGFETYAAVYMACDGSENEALDRAVAAKLLPSVIRTVSGRIDKDERGLSETLDAIFGEDHTTACRRTVAESGADII